MMKEVKESFGLVTTPEGVIDTYANDDLKGGNTVLEDKLELAAKFGIDVESLDFSIEDLSVEELTAKFEAMQAEPEPEAQEPEQTETEEFALTGNVLEEICRTLEETKVEFEWGTLPRYCYADCDMELKEVYCWDRTDWLLYGFS